MQKTRNQPCWLVALLLLGLPACKDEAVRRDSGPAVDRPSTVDAPPAATCGDGVRNGTEACDGQDMAGRICTTEGFGGGNMICRSDCTLDTSGCYKCGDGSVGGNEQCDGANLGGKTCQTEGFTSGTLACTAACQLDLSGCQIATCGNGKRDASEACEGSDLGGKTCQTAGFTGGTLTCASNCSLNTSQCFKCGDGVINGTEQCDGAQLGGKTCVTQGFTGGSLGCTATCTFHTAACFKCGDGVISGAEACDGTQLGGKTCVTQGFASGTLSCSANCTLNTTGCKSATTDGGTGTATKTVSYTEPTTITGATACSTTGGALTNLDHTTIYYSIGTKPPVIAATIPATSPGGGGSVTKAVTVTGLAPGANQVKFWVTATNSKQQESDPTCSQQVTLTIP